MQGRIRVSDGSSLVADELASGARVELLPGWRLPAGPPLYAVYPARQWLALNTATIVEFLLARYFSGHA